MKTRLFQAIRASLETTSRRSINNSWPGFVSSSQAYIRAKIIPIGEASLIYANIQLTLSLSLSHSYYGNKCLIWKRNCIRWIVREPEATQQLHKIATIPIPSSHDLWKWGHTADPKIEARIMSDEFVGNGARATMRNMWETTQLLPFANVENYYLLKPNFYKVEIIINKHEEDVASEKNLVPIN